MRLGGTSVIPIARRELRVLPVARLGGRLPSRCASWRALRLHTRCIVVVVALHVSISAFA
jgi:hypothetical protein